VARIGLAPMFADVAGEEALKIAVIAPARPLDQRLVGPLQEIVAEFPEVTLHLHPQCFLGDGHFAGPDAARADALIEVGNDPAIDAVWFARGGYGSNRLLARVMPALGPAAGAKTYLGYSDAGFLLGALHARGIGRVAHGPMPGDLARSGGEAAVRRALAWLARGDVAALEPGLGARPAAAFNLTILATLAGTPWLPDLTGHELLIEEVSEPLYRVDRLLFQLAHATALAGIAGVRLGRVSDVIANDPPWGEALAAMIARWCAERGAPYLGRAEIGHDAANRIVPFGSAAIR